jgi:RimJ/RimL family protein N-acetyltransferase
MGTARLTLLEPPCAPQPPDARSILIETSGSFAVVLSRERRHSIRAVTPADTALLADLIARLSDNARRLRFFRPLPHAELIWQEAARVTQREPRLGVALVATAPERSQACAVALAELVHDPAAPGVAELAVMVRDDEQRRGVGTLLLRRLIALARRRDVRVLRATLQVENWPARHLLRKLGLSYRTEIQHGELTVWAELP